MLGDVSIEKFSIYKRKKVPSNIYNKRFLFLFNPFTHTHTHTLVTISKMSNLGALDMALDDVISQNRTNKRSSNSNTGGRRGGSSRGGISKNRSSGSRSSVC